MKLISLRVPHYRLGCLEVQLIILIKYGVDLNDAFSALTYEKYYDFWLVRDVMLICMLLI